MRTISTFCAGGFDASDLARLCDCDPSTRPPSFKRLSVPLVGGWRGYDLLFDSTPSRRYGFPRDVDLAGMVELLGHILVQQLAAHFHTAEGNGQEPRVASLPFGDFLDLVRLAFAALTGADDFHGLDIFARTFPTEPSLAFDFSDAGQLVSDCNVQVFDVSLSPKLADVFEIPGNRCLIDLEFMRDMG